MSSQAWKRYYQYGCVSLAQKKFGEAIRDFRKALLQAERIAIPACVSLTEKKLQLATALANEAGLVRPASLHDTHSLFEEQTPVVTLSAFAVPEPYATSLPAGAGFAESLRL